MKCYISLIKLSNKKCIIFNVGEYFTNLYYFFGKQLSRMHPKAQKYLYSLIQVSQL